MKMTIATAAFALLAAPALADGHITGDVANGEEQFNRQCVACHVVVNEAGETLAGRNARTGPNLYGIPEGTAGTVDGFRYSAGFETLAEQGATWDEAGFVAYVQDPTEYLRTTLEDPRARGKMAYKVREEQDAIDIYAYIASLLGGE